LTRVEEQALVPYLIHKPRKVLVIGTGGGQDLAAALYYGAGSVTGIEMNKYLVEMMRGQFAQRSNRLFLDPRVHIIKDEARHALRYLDDRFDLIVIQRPWTRYFYDRFVHITSNFLLTPDALRDYWRRLTPDGLLYLALPAWEDSRQACSSASLEKILLAESLPDVMREHMAVLGLRVQNQFRQRDMRLMCIALFAKHDFNEKDRAVLSGLGGVNVHFSSGADPTQRRIDSGVDRKNADGEWWLETRPWLWVFFAAMLFLLLVVKYGIKPLPTDFPAPVYVALGIAYFWLEAQLLMRASFFIGDISLAYQLVLCSLVFFGGLGYIHAARLERGLVTLGPVLLAIILLLADLRLSILWDRGPGVWMERIAVVCFCGAIGYLCAFPFGYLMSREKQPIHAYAWDGLGMFFGYFAVPLALNHMPLFLVYGDVLLYGAIAGWIFVHFRPLRQSFA
jgi:SAM-dependent methyltransferase